MTLLTIDYEVEDHRPDDFLGRHVSLPEIDWFPHRHVIENPVDSVDALLEFASKSSFFKNGYDQKLAKSNWGVWQARQLEAAWWRLQDACAQEPRLAHGWGPRVRQPEDGHGPAESLQLSLDSYTSRGRIFLRHMSICHMRSGKHEVVAIPKEKEWPEIPESDQILGLPGVAEREAFWRPLSAYSVSEALNGFNAMRFGKRKFIMPILANPGADPRLAFRGTFGDQAGAAFDAWWLSRNLEVSLSNPNISVDRLRM